MPINSLLKHSVHFQRTFWFAIATELLERLAYYGMLAYLSVYMTRDLHFSTEKAGLIQGAMKGITYMIPILAGALADRYGFRRALLLAFSILIGAYLLCGHVTNYIPFAGALILVAIGGAIVKPTIAGTVKRGSSDEYRTVGFSIYYMVVNIGAFIGPYLVNRVREATGKPSKIFWVSTIASIIALLVIGFGYREIGLKENEKGERKSLLMVIGEAGLVLRNWRFVLFLVLFSGIHILYQQVEFAIPLHLVRLNPKINVEFYAMINPMLIVFLTVVMGKLTAKYRILPILIGGVILASISLMIMGLAVAPWIVVVSIAVWSVGEMAFGPRYTEYIATIAPPDKLALYLGWGFLTISLGSFIGGPLGGYLFEIFVARRGSLIYFWWTFAGIGMLTALLLIIYDKMVAHPDRKIVKSGE